MNSAKGLYSLIQYRPDESRLETINLGVALLSDDLGYLSARWTETAQARIRKVFGKQDWSLVESQISAVKYRLATFSNFGSSAEFVRFMETRSGAVILTEPRFVKVHEPTSTLDALFSRLVGEVSRIKRAPRVNQKLTKVLKRRGLLPYVTHNVEISIPKLKKTLRASYGYQNGRYNLVQPEQFGLSDDEQVFQKASRLAVEGKYVHDERDPELGRMQLVIVGHFRANQTEARALVNEIFGKNDVRLFSFDQIDPLLIDIERNARKHGLDGPLNH